MKTLTLDKWKVRKAMDAAGLTGLDVSYHFGVSKETINRWIRTENWGFVHAAELGNILRVDVASLLKEKE